MIRELPSHSRICCEPMPVATPFGDNVHSQCHIASELVLANLEPDAPRVESLQQAVLDALMAPANYPPLAEATVPGDVVLFAFGKEVAEIESIAQAIISYCRQSQFADRRLQFLLPHGAPSAVVESVRSLIQQNADKNPTIDWEVIVHEPQDQKANAFLTSTQENRAIILNRHLCDADVVVPIDVAHSAESFKYFGPFSAIFPTYSDIDSQKRWNSPLFVTRKPRLQRRLREVEEVRQLLGIVYNLLLLPARGGGYGAVVFGEAGQVSQQVAQQLKQKWQPNLPELAGVVIALLTGGRSGQTWENAARALANVENLVRPGGAILLCTEIRDRPGPALAQMGESLEFTDFESQMEKSRQDDAAVAMQFARTLSQCKVYFRSQLSEAVLDLLDLIPVESDDECRRICEHYQDVVIVHDAQDLAVSLADTSLSS